MTRKVTLTRTTPFVTETITVETDTPKPASKPAPKFKAVPNFQGGTCLQGYWTGPYKRIVEVLGEPHSDGDAYKVQAEWIIEFPCGTIATIYDWKEGDSYNGQGQGIPKEQVVGWHVGGVSPKAETLVRQLLG